MPAYWTAARIANEIHRQILAPHGFTRRGARCELQAGGLRRTLTVLTRSRTTDPQIQLLAEVTITALPPTTTRHRCEGLSGTAETPTGRHHYPLPAAPDPLPPDLPADVAGPIRTFLLAADGLAGFVLWAQQVFAGDERPGHWGRYRPVLPQGTGPLQTAAMLGDAELTGFLAARIENEEPNEHRFDDFLADIRQFCPHLHHRHPIIRPALQ